MIGKNLFLVKNISENLCVLPATLFQQICVSYLLHFFMPTASVLYETPVTSDHDLLSYNGKTLSVDDIHHLIIRIILCPFYRCLHRPKHVSRNVDLSSSVTKRTHLLLPLLSPLIRRGSFHRLVHVDNIT
jgi:hypothetical protein